MMRLTTSESCIEWMASQNMVLPVRILVTELVSDNAVIGALIFIALIIGANFVMYAIAHGATKGGDSRWISALKQGLSRPLDSQANKSMDELRQKLEELQKNDKKEE